MTKPKPKTREKTIFFLSFVVCVLLFLFVFVFVSFHLFSRLLFSSSPRVAFLSAANNANKHEMSFRGSFRGGAGGGAARGGFDGKMSVMTQVRKEKEVETARLHAKVRSLLFPSPLSIFSWYCPPSG